MKKMVLISLAAASLITLSACTAKSNNSSTSSSNSASNKTKASSKNASSSSSNSKLKSEGTSTSTTSNGDYVISNISSWNHPVKNIFEREAIKINKVVLQNNKTYPVFYVTLSKELNAENKAYYTKLMKEIALANGYWDYEVIDSSKGADIKVKCKNKNAIESITYNKDSSYFTVSSAQVLSKEQELVNYLTSNVSEVKSFVDVHANNTTSKASIYVERYPDETSTNTYEKSYYIIYVGEAFSDHTVNTYRFAINKDTNEILYYDTANDKYETLTEWRSNKK
ncbi:hypothetical protein NL50_15740 [Clostridium acetobutylicum]|nr:hypothetical protein NL50_15740 [Clostridium acetobutylicum]